MNNEKKAELANNQQADTVPNDTTLSAVPREDIFHRGSMSKKSEAPFGGSFHISLISTAVFLPILATLTTVGLYFAFPLIFPPLTLILGLFLAFIMMVYFALYSMYSTTVEGGNIQGYNMLRSGQIELLARLAIPSCETNDFYWVTRQYVKNTFELDYLGRQSTAALQEAYTAIDFISENFSKRGSMQWVTGTGYVYTWGLIHRAEEALMEVDALPIVIREAMRDRLNLDNSNVENRDDLLKELLLAVGDLDPDAIRYFKKGDKNLREEIEIQRLDTASKRVTSPSDEELKPSPQVQAKARAALRQVKHQLNKFREDRLAALIQAKGNLIMSTVAIGSVTYILILMAILSSAKPLIIVGAIAYYIIGTAIGLFGRLYNESIATSAINDYGLSLSRLMAVPLLSGLAAIGGVFFVEALTSVNSGSLPQSLMNVFSFTPYHFVIAAAFGLTPNLLIKGLQIKSDRLISDLESI